MASRSRCRLASKSVSACTDPRFIENFESLEAALQAATFCFECGDGRPAHPMPLPCAHSFRRLFLQVHVHHIFHGKPQEPRSHLLEFLRRIRRKELEPGSGSPIALHGSGSWLRLEMRLAPKLARHILRG